MYTTFTILAEADMLKIMETRHPHDPAHKGMVQNLSTNAWEKDCLLYTSDAADEEDSVDLGGRRII